MFARHASLTFIRGISSEAPESSKIYLTNSLTCWNSMGTLCLVPYSETSVMIVEDILFYILFKMCLQLSTPLRFRSTYYSLDLDDLSKSQICPSTIRQSYLHFPVAFIPLYWSNFVVFCILFSLLLLKQEVYSQLMESLCLISWSLTFSSTSSFY